MKTVVGDTYDPGTNYQKRFTQSKLNDSVRESDLPKNLAEYWVPDWRKNIESAAPITKSLYNNDVDTIK